MAVHAMQTLDYAQLLETVVAVTPHSAFWRALSRRDKRSLSITSKALRPLVRFLTRTLELNLGDATRQADAASLLRQLGSLNALKVTLTSTEAGETTTVQPLLECLESGCITKILSSLEVITSFPRGSWRPAIYSSPEATSLVTLLPRLQTLVLDRCRISDAFFQSLAQASCLRELSLYRADMQGTGNLSALTSLTRLCCCYDWFVHSEEPSSEDMEEDQMLLDYSHMYQNLVFQKPDIPSIAHLTGLRHLQLVSMRGLAPAELDALWPSLTSLTNLELANLREFKSDQEPQASHITALQQLRVLTVSDCPWFGEQGVETLEALPHLERLQLCSIRFPPMMQATPPPHATLASLKTLIMTFSRYNGVLGVELNTAWYLLSAAPSLERLQLSGISVQVLQPGVGPEYLEMLARRLREVAQRSAAIPGLGRMSQLCFKSRIPMTLTPFMEALQPLQGSCITEVRLWCSGWATGWGRRLDLDAEALAALASSLPQLQELAIHDFASVDGRGLLPLVRLPGLRKVLIVGSQNAVRQEDVAAFQQQAPNVKLEVEGA